MYKRKVLYCKRVNPEDFLKCDRNCMLLISKEAQLKGCVFGKEFDVDWVSEETNAKGNITCNKCSTKKKRIYVYDKISFYDVGLWICYNCGAMGYSIKDPFSKGSIWDKGNIEKLFKTYGKEWWLEIFNQIEMFNK